MIICHIKLIFFQELTQIDADSKRQAGADQLPVKIPVYRSLSEVGIDLDAVFGMDRVLKRIDRDFFQAP
jgi:hypothetical protein